MNLFQMKSKPHNVDRLSEFLHEGYVCIGWPGIGDLANIEKEELRSRLAKTYGYEGQALANRLGAISTFVHSMKKGDIILILENNWVHIGKVGEYVYHAEYDNEDDGKCHQRHAQWINTAPRDDLNSKVEELLRNRGTVTKFKHPFAVSELDQWIYRHNAMEKATEEYKNIKRDALEILKGELKSADPDRRLKAAIEILRHMP